MTKLSFDYFRDLKGYLESDYSLYDAVSIFATYPEYHHTHTLLDQLNRGYSFETIIQSCDVDRDFKDLVQMVSSLNNLSESIQVALHVSEIKRNLYRELVKQLSYPILLLFLLSCFAFVMIYWLYPQMKILLSSFDIKQDLLLELGMMLIRWIPIMINLVVMVVVLWAISLACAISSHNRHTLQVLLHVSMYRVVIQTYFSLKFAIYFAVINHYIPGLNHCIEVLYTHLKYSDLVVVIYDMKLRLEQGQALIDILVDDLFLLPSLKHFIQRLWSLDQSLVRLTDFVKTTEKRLERKLKTGCHFVTSVSYLVTGIYILLLYMTILLPLMSVGSSL